MTGGFFWLFAALAMVALAVSALVLFLPGRRAPHDGGGGVGTLRAVEGGLRLSCECPVPALGRMFWRAVAEPRISHKWVFIGCSLTINTRERSSTLPFKKSR